jgi:hypothetical protein
VTIGPVIFGDNQFLGINHADAAKAASFSGRFSSVDAVLEVLGWAYDCGIRDFMFTTHERLRPVFSEIVRSRLFPEMGFIPCLPYAHKYADAMSDGGFLGVARRHLWHAPKGRLLRSAAKVGVGDFEAGMELLVEIEVQMARGLSVRGVFLQNVFFDLLMGLSAVGLIERFHRHVEDRFKAVPGYITMNHIFAQDLLCQRMGIDSPWLCSNFNVAGFRMNPSRDAVVDAYANGSSRNIAMSVFASGSLPGAAALDFVCGAKGVDAVLFGSGSQANIRTNCQAFQAALGGS